MNFTFQVLYGGIWKTGSGYTIGEEDEQIFSYLSRTGPTIKHMLPESKFYSLRIELLIDEAYLVAALQN